MTQLHAPVALTTATATRRSSAWPALALAVLSVAAWAVFFALPYYVNDLDRFSLTEVTSGLHDPKDLWPYIDGGLLAAVFALGSMFTLATAPFTGAAAVVWACLNLWRERAQRVRPGRIALSLVTIAFGTAAIAWLGTPLGSALITWWLD